MTLGSVCEALESLWPAGGAQEWDATGVVVGEPSDLVSHIRLVVDVVPGTVAEAQGAGADLIIAHHPLLLTPVHSVAEDRYKGRVISSLIRANIGLVTAHTNADVVPTGTSRHFANRLGLVTTDVISPSATPGHGIGQIGSLPTPCTLYELASKLAEILPPTASGIRVSGDPEATIATVALCAGAGDSLLNHPKVAAADVYITSDLRHHPASEVAAQRDGGFAPALIDVSHFAAEWLWLEGAAVELRDMFPGIRVTISDLVTDPWDFVVLPGPPTGN
jgi:dinuclear metal center YbgI/SA1388 family protein